MEKTHSFSQKMAIFPTFCLANIGQENMFYDILELKKRLFRLKKQQVQKVEKLRFFQRGSRMILVQKWPFFQLSFLAI